MAGLSFLLGIIALFLLPGLLGASLKSGRLWIYALITLQELLLIGIPALLISLRSLAARLDFLSLWKHPGSYSLGLSSLSAVSFSLAGILIAVLWISLMEVLGIRVPLERSPIMPQSIGEYLLAFLTSALLPAFAEELLFRGLLLQAFRRRLGDRWALWLTALLFSILHLSLQGFGVLLVIGLFLAGLTLRYESLWPAVLFHGLYNTAAILLNGLKALPSPQMVWLCSGIFIACCYLLFRREPARNA